SPIPTSLTALGEARSHRLQHRVDQLVVIEQLVDATERPIHQLLGVRSAKEHGVPETSLTVSPSNHRPVLIMVELCSSIKISTFGRLLSRSLRESGCANAHFSTAV